MPWVINSKLTAEDIDRILGGAGATFGDVTGEVTQDDFTSFEITIDVSGVTIH